MDGRSCSFRGTEVEEEETKLNIAVEFDLDADSKIFRKTCEAREVDINDDSVQMVMVGELEMEKRKIISKSGAKSWITCPRVPLPVIRPGHPTV